MKDALESANHEDESMPHLVIPDQGHVNQVDMLVSDDGEEAENKGQENEGDLLCGREVRQ